ncbi:MAG: PTS fructose transporter subunit IIA [Rubrivivax sp.]
MASILLVAHAPLASALQAVAGHAFAESCARVRAIDVAADTTLAAAEVLVCEALADLAAAPALGTVEDADVLVLTDVFGATPCNAALAAADSRQAVRVVAGVNVPMLWRALCYAQLPVAELVMRAIDGGRQGIMQIAAPRRHNQNNPPRSDDPDTNSDQ